MTTIKKITKQPYDYYCILDFEATATGKTRKDIWEIIEFPVVLLNSSTLKVEDEFHTYVQPIHQKLNDICIGITGIKQETVDKAPKFEKVMYDLHQWMLKHKLIDEKNQTQNCIFVTCGDWDIKTMIPTQCDREKFPIPFYMKSWINIKNIYSKTYNQKEVGMAGMLKYMKLPLIGHHHSGIDDTRNICSIVVKLIQDGALIK